MDGEITNGMLYELLRDFKEDVNRRFAEQDKKFDDVNRRFDDVNRRLDELNSLIRKDQEKLQQVYDARERVEVRFTRAWGLTSLGMGILGGGFFTFLGRFIG